MLEEGHKSHIMNDINDINDIAHSHYMSKIGHRAALLKMSIHVHTTVAVVASVCYGNSGNSLFCSNIHYPPGSRFVAGNRTLIPVRGQAPVCGIKSKWFRCNGRLLFEFVHSESSINSFYDQTRMHSSRMRTTRCNCHFSCHAHPPATHALLPQPPHHACPPPCMPPTMHAPLHHAQCNDRVWNPNLSPSLLVEMSQKTSVPTIMLVHHCFCRIL